MTTTLPSERAQLVCEAAIAALTQLDDDLQVRYLAAVAGYDAYVLGEAVGLLRVRAATQRHLLIAMDHCRRALRWCPDEVPSSVLVH